MADVSGAGAALKGFGSKAINAIPGVKAASTGGTVAKGVETGAGFRLGSSAVQAIRTVSLVMVIIGMVHWYIRYKLGYSPIVTWISLILFILAGYAVTNKVKEDKIGVFFPMGIFLLWYFGFSGRYDPNFLIYFVSLSALILAISAFITKGKIIRPEGWGLLPILFFYLDIGLIPFLTNTLGFTVTSALENLVVWMPWWAFFGLLMLPTEEKNTSNSIINLVKVIGIIYLVVVIIIPAFPAVAYEQAIPGIEEFEEAQSGVREQVGYTENPAWSSLICTFQLIGNIASADSVTVDECIAERQLNSQLNYICTQELGYDKKEDKEGYDQCLIDEKERMEEEEQELMQGTIDRSILEKTEATFIIDKSSFPSERKVKVGSEQYLTYPMSLKIENPREMDIYVTMSCNFTNTQTEESFLGDVSPSAESVLVNEKSDTISHTCSPPNDKTLNGTYNLFYSAELSGLETDSHLTRLFVEEYNEENEVLQEVIRNNFLGSNSLSEAPNEFARINFGFGEPETNPIVEKEDNILLISSIENTGTGEVTRVNGYSVELDPYLYVAEFEENEFTCLYGDELTLYGETISKGSVPLSICFLELSGELDSLVENQGFELRTFMAKLYYDYKIKTQNKIEVVIVESQG